MNKYKLLLAAIIVSGYAQAQNEADILRFSQTYNMGTARSQGVGGAFGAIGADMSSGYINPAGFGLYRRNELQLSAAVTGTLTSANFLGETQSDSRTNFNLPSFGAVFSKVNTGMRGDASSGVVNYNFGFGYNRTNSFQQNTYMEGYNSRSNLSQFFIDQSNGIPSNQITATGSEFNFSNLGWNAYLTDTLNNNTSYYSPWFEGDNDYRVLQTQKITRRGSMDDYNFSGAVNFDNILYLGAGLVINTLHQEYTSLFTESDPDNTVTTTTGSGNGNYYKSSYLKTDVKTTGTGVAGRFGVILRPIDIFRIGLSVQTASRINMKDEYQYKVGSEINWPGIGKVDASSPQGTYNYQLITPARFTASAALTLPKYGFISIDADRINYTSGRLTSSDFSFGQANSNARNLFQEAYQIGVGAEVKVKDVYRFRTGYNVATSPYKNAIAGISVDDLTRYGYSFGAGYTNGNYFVDAALITTTFNEYYTPYTVTGVYSPTGKASHTVINVAVTGGIRF